MYSCFKTHFMLFQACNVNELIKAVSLLRGIRYFIDDTRPALSWGCSLAGSCGCDCGCLNMNMEVDLQCSNNAKPTILHWLTLYLIVCIAHVSSSHWSISATHACENTRWSPTVELLEVQLSVGDQRVLGCHTRILRSDHAACSHEIRAWCCTPNGLNRSRSLAVIRVRGGFFGGL